MAKKPKLVAEKRSVFRVGSYDLSVFRVGSYDLDVFMRKVYNHDLEFTEVRECSNDSSHEIFNITSDDLDEWEQTDVKDFKESGISGWGTPRALLRDCCIRGLVEPGDYIIRVCW